MSDGKICKITTVVASAAAELLSWTFGPHVAGHLTDTMHSTSCFKHWASQQARNAVRLTKKKTRKAVTIAPGKGQVFPAKIVHPSREKKRRDRDDRAMGEARKHEEDEDAPLGEMVQSWQLVRWRGASSPTRRDRSAPQNQERQTRVVEGGKTLVARKATGSGPMDEERGQPRTRPRDHGGRESTSTWGPSRKPVTPSSLPS